MIRRLNYTGRKRLSRGDVNVRMVAAPDGRPRFTATFALERHGLPPTARVFVEAYRQTSWQRFDFGTVATPGALVPALLRDFGSAQGVRFRVRVVEAVTSEHAPRVLALADGLRPAAPPDAKGGLSLLPVDWGDFEAHTWKLEIDDESGPLLRISRVLVPDRDAFVGSNEFLSLVLPSVLRRILERALLLGTAEDDDGEAWAADWLTLAREWPGVGPPPGRERADTLGDDEEDWLDAAVEAFARTSGIAGRFRKWWEPGPA